MQKSVYQSLLYFEEQKKKKDELKKELREALKKLNMKKLGLLDRAVILNNVNAIKEFRDANPVASSFSDNEIADMAAVVYDSKKKNNTADAEKKIKSWQRPARSENPHSITRSEMEQGRRETQRYLRNKKSN